MCRWAWSAALGGGLAVLTATRPASADVVYVGSGGSQSQPVPLMLRIKDQSADLRVYRRDDKVELVSPLVGCRGNCTFNLLPGAYKLHLEGPDGSNIESGARTFELRGPSALYVDPGSSTARWLGFGLGLLGPSAMLLGVAMLAEANDNSLNGSHRDSTKEFAGGACVVGGIMLTIGGWIMFASNGRPHLEIVPLRPATPPPAPAPLR